MRTSPRRTVFSNVLKFTHVDSGTLGTGAALERAVVKKSIIDDVVVDLRDDGGEVVVLPHECHKLWRRSVDGQQPWLNFEVLEHVLVKSLSAARPLSRLVNVKVEYTHRVNFVLKSKINKQIMQ